MTATSTANEAPTRHAREKMRTHETISDDRLLLMVFTIYRNPGKGKMGKRLGRSFLISGLDRKEAILYSVEVLNLSIARQI
jgi:hypothetical protein